MSKIKIKCLQCWKQIEAEPGVETICPHCGNSFKLKAEVTQADFPKDDTQEHNRFGNIMNEIYKYEEEKNYEEMKKCAKKLLEIEDEVYEGWAYLAIAEAGIVSKLIDENKFSDNTKLEEIDTYFENAYENSFNDKEIEKLRPVHSAFLKKNLFHAATLTINHLQSLIDELQLSIKGELKEDKYKDIPKDEKQKFIDKFINIIAEQKHNLQVYETLNDEELIATAQKIMIKNKPAE